MESGRHVVSSRLEEYLGAQQARQLGLVLDTRMDFVAVLDDAGCHLDANEVLSTLLGYSREQVLGKSPLQLYWPSEDRAAFERLLARSRAGTTTETQLSLLHIAGHAVEVQCEVCAYSTELVGKPLFVLRIREAWERRDAKAEPRQSAATLTARVAHDFNNVLTVVLASCSLASRRDPDNKKLQADLNAARAAAKRGAALSKQLLAYGQTRESLEPSVLLSDVIAETSLLIDKAVGERVEWSLQPPQRLWPTRVGALDAETIITSLAGRASDAMPNGGTLSLSLHNLTVDERTDARAREAGLAIGRYVVLTLAAAAVGARGGTAAPEERVMSARATIEQRGGLLLVDTPTDGDLVFTVYFPAADAASQDVSPTAETGPLLEGTETLLLVEDLDSVRDAMRSVLERQGYRVLEANGVEEARAVLANHTDAIDAILTDVMLADGTGPEFVEEALAQHPHLPVLYMTGYANASVLDKRKRSARAPLLSKPFTPAQLCQQLRHLFDDDRDP